MQALKATSSIRRLIASLDIYFNSLNSEVQKQNKTKIKRLQRLLTQWFLGFIAINFFNRKIFSKNKLGKNLVV